MSNNSRASEFYTTRTRSRSSENVAVLDSKRPHQVPTFSNGSLMYKIQMHGSALLLQRLAAFASETLAIVMLFLKQRMKK